VGRIVPFAVALLAALVLAPGARWLGTAWGLVDRAEDGLKIHQGAVSVLGGAAVAVGTFVALAALGVAVPVAVVAAVALILVTGLVDDIRPVSWWARTTLQVAAGAVLVAGGMTLGLSGWLGAAALMAVAVASANAVNLTDGQDGLAGGLGAVAAAALALVASRLGMPDLPAVGWALAGALAGFVAWNLSPARIFLGNGGAYAVGIMLAVLAARVVASLGLIGLLVAGLCLGMFVFELVFTVGRRIGGRTPLTAGDRLHSYDLVATLLGSRRLCTLLYWGFGVLVGGLGLLSASLAPGEAVAVASGAALAGVIAGLLLWRRAAEESR
jgi:UDP-GlcNAc:undecaprenyl-phosphate GlcNAc-1-phosphate transferase